MLPDGSYGGNPAGFLITPASGGDKVYFACDTALFMDMQLYGDEGLAAAFLPIGDNFTMGPADAVRAVEFLRPKIAVPVHYNTWPPIKQDAEAWKREVEAKTDTEVRVLQPGETLEIY
jgi:L-ascorbate metabolism protein UlaG (beta-lactamase superfamily)